MNIRFKISEKANPSTYTKTDQMFGQKANIKGLKSDLSGVTVEINHKKITREILNNPCVK